MDANVAEGFRKFGMSEAEIEALQEKDREALAQAQEAADFDVYEDNEESWLFFLAVQTQWIYASGGMGWQRMGMNFTGVESGARMAGRPRSTWPALFADLRGIEHAVLQADAERQEKST
jgi:hypothetical protein